MKKSVAAAVTIAIFAVFFLSCAFAPAGRTKYRAILNDTPIYAEKSLSSEIIFEVPGDAEVTFEGEKEFEGGTWWIKARFGDVEGFMIFGDLYPSRRNRRETVKARASTDAMGKSVPLYPAPSADAEPTGRANDGETLLVTDDGVDYGGFSLAEYKGETYFVKDKNISYGLSFNQRLALIIFGVFSGAVISATIIVVVVRRRKKRVGV